MKFKVYNKVPIFSIFILNINFICLNKAFLFFDIKFNRDFIFVDALISATKIVIFLLIEHH